MEHPLLDAIFQELYPYDSTFTEIIEQAEKEKSERDRQQASSENSSRAILESPENKEDGLNQKKEIRTMTCKQVDEVSDVPSVEEGIANQLRKCCNLFGREIPEELSLSSKYLLELGKVYLNYTVQNDWTKQFTSELETIQNELILCTANEPDKCEIVKEKFEIVLFTYFEIDLRVGERGKDIQLYKNAMEPIIQRMKFCFSTKDPEKREVTNKQLRELFRKFKIQQNLNFVKAAALIVGSMVRYEILKDSDLIHMAKEELRNLWRGIMKIDHVKGDGSNIFEFMNEIKRTLESNRLETAVHLESISQIPEDSSENAAQDGFRMRDSKVREICEQCTEYYLDIMGKVAEKCESIMGKPPCKFAIIGLGSLARKEVTLYSDFEHAILLEDGIDDYSGATEYFRWFSTIFQVIVIGLGETVIPSVAVKSLNDFYSSDESRNWFVDNVTPNGVSFDGTMPPACKIPLGRQETTKHRNHTVELIHPVSKMVNFLNKAEDVKNGYFLSDILSKVCFVFGCREVYDDYIQKSGDLMKNRTLKEIFGQQRDMLKSNPNLGVKITHYSNFISDGKIKTSSYRPLTTLLSCAAALHSLSAQSSFEIVDELRNREIIDDETRRKLISAVTTAMEIRLKTYLQAGNQRENVSTTDLEKIVGKKRLMNCYLTLNMLKKWLREEMSESLGGMPRFFSEYVMEFECAILTLFEEYEKAMWSTMQSIHRIIHQFQNSEITALESRLLLLQRFEIFFRCFIQVSPDKGVDTQEQDNLISSLQSQPWEWLHGIAMRYCENEWYLRRAMLHKFLYILYMWQGKHECAHKEKVEVIRLYIKNLQTGLFDQLRIEPDFVEFMLQVMSPDECLQQLNELLNDAKDFCNRCVLRLGICQTLLAKGMKKQARVNFLTLVTDISENARRLGQFLFHRLLFKIDDLQRCNGMESMSVKILLRYNVHDVEQHKDLKTDPKSLLDTMEYPYLQGSWANTIDQRINSTYNLTSLTRLIWIITRCFSAFSRRKTIPRFNDMINAIKPKGKDPTCIHETAWLMVLCENCHASDLNYLIDFLQTTPDIVTAAPIIQPFLSALLADFLQRPTASSTGCSVQLRTRDQLLQISSKQRAVIQALFRYSGKGGNLHNIAIGHFNEFRFEECARLSWKQLQRRGNNQTLQERSMKLFLTTTLATVVLQKRRSPAKYFEKTHETSMRQIFFMIGTTLSVEVENFFWLYRYNFEGKEKTLVQVFNLAVEYYGFGPQMGITLLWKIVHAPNVTASVLKDSLHRFIMFVDWELWGESNGPITYIPID